jgi:vitamin B12 transporter
VLIDGVPVNQPGGTFNFANLTTDNIERIDVLRGPAGVLYGSDAMTGVVQLFTRRGAGRPRLSASGLGGTFGSSQFEAVVAGGSQRLGYSASLGRVGSAGVYDVNNAFRNTIASGRLDARVGATTRIAGTARYADARHEFPTDFTGAPVDSNQYNTESNLTLGLDVAQPLGRTVEARLLLASNDGRFGFEDRSDSPADTTGFGFDGSQQGEAARRSIDARAVVRAIEHVTLTAGAAYEREAERLDSRFTSNFGDGGFTDRTSYDEARGTLAGYVQGVAELPAAVSLTAGVRLDDNDAFGRFAPWRLGAAWRVASATRVRGSVGTAYKAPKFRELFIAVPFEVGNPDLRPERSTTWEAGVEQGFAGGHADVGVTWFSSRFRDLIQYSLVDFEDASVPTYYNLGAADARGLEVEASVRPLAGLTVDAQYTWLHTEVTDAGASLSPVFEAGAPLLRRPAHSGWLRVAGRPVARVGLGANLNVVGERDDVDFGAAPAARVVLPGYVLLEATADIALLARGQGRPGIDLVLRVENLLDADYLATVGFPGRGRTILAGARVGY